jgi:anti-anti-sigma factor
MKAMPSSRDIITVALPERLDSATAPAAEKRLLDALNPGARVVVDGFAISYMSAAGVRLLATALHVAEERGVHIAFCRFEGAAWTSSPRSRTLSRVCEAFPDLVRPAACTPNVVRVIKYLIGCGLK